METRTERISILVDDTPLDIIRGERFSEVLANAGIRIEEGQIIISGLREKKISRKEQMMGLYFRDTQITIELFNDWSTKTLFMEKAHSEMSVQQRDANVISIGAYRSESVGKFEEYELQEGAVYCDQIGLDNNRTCLLLCRKKHRAFYSLTSPMPVGRIVTGMEKLNTITLEDDLILKPLDGNEVSEHISYSKVTDLSNKVVNDGTKILTRVKTRIFSDNPSVGDIFLRLFDRGVFKVASTTGAFISVDGLREFKVENCGNNFINRARGGIYIRNTGINLGSYYFYRSLRSPSCSHLLIGEVTSGMEIIDMASPNDIVCIESSPRPLNCIGMSQSQAENYLSEMGFNQIRRGDKQDDALVVSQDPSSSLLISDSNDIDTIGLSSDSIIKVRLFENDARMTVNYIRNVTGLTLEPIGHLRVEQGYSSVIGAMLLSGNSERITIPNLNVENIPTGRVTIGTMGVTNSVVDRKGMIGIRIEESEEFGPTMESFECTNIVGEVANESLKILKELKSGQDIYIMEL